MAEPTSDEYREAICRFLVSSTLSDHLGDVRGAEDTLWAILGIDRDELWDAYDDERSAFQVARSLAIKHGLPFPEWALEDDDDDDDE